MAKKAWDLEFEKEGVVPAGKLLTKDWLATWLATYKKPSVRQNTFEGERRIVEKHLIPEIGSYKLKDLRTEHIQKMINDKLDHGSLKKQFKTELDPKTGKANKIPVGNNPLSPGW